MIFGKWCFFPTIRPETRIDYIHIRIIQIISTNHTISQSMNSDWWFLSTSSSYFDTKLKAINFHWHCKTSMDYFSISTHKYDPYRIILNNLSYTQAIYVYVRFVVKGWRIVQMKHIIFEWWHGYAHTIDKNVISLHYTKIPIWNW